MRQDRKRTVVNRAKKDELKTVLKLAKSKPTAENVSKAFSALDKAAKVGLIHKGKAARTKSRLPSAKATPQKSTKISPKKQNPKKSK
jgi:ribosomal protein S20